MAGRWSVIGFGSAVMVRTALTSGSRGAVSLQPAAANATPSISIVLIAFMFFSCILSASTVRHADHDRVASEAHRRVDLVAFQSDVREHVVVETAKLANGASAQQL